MNARRALCATIGAGLALAAAAPAVAHVELVGTTAPDLGLVPTSSRSGAVVPRLPNPVRITFGEPPLRVVGVTVTRAGTDHAVRARLNPANARQVLVSTRNPRAGRYRVAWRVTAPDGDPQTGTFAFRVGG